MKKTTANKYTIARNNLLLVLILTVVNIVLLFMESDTMFLFSATIPYMAAAFGYMLEWFACYIVAAIVLLLYAACWYFSKKHPAWMIVAAVLFVLDTFAMLWVYDFTFDVSIIFDVLVHIWVLYYLVMGIRNGTKIKQEAAGDFEKAAKPQQEEEKIPSASPIRMAEETKNRVLLEETVLGKSVVYRRVKRTNELVINGYVYDEYEALVETAHVLSANVDDHVIEVGFDGVGSSFLKLDGEVVKKKIRLV